MSRTKAFLLRLLLNIGLLVAVLFSHWVVVVGLALVLLMFFNAWEVLLWGVVMDLLYAAPVPAYSNFEFIFSISFLVGFFLVTFLKKRLIFY